MAGFSSFEFLDDINIFLKESKLKKPTEVQEKSIPHFLNNENLSVLAQTGTGKTLSYALPLFHKVKMNDDDIPMESQIGSPRGILITPTRELNTQVFKVLKSIAHHCKLRIRDLVGGDKGKRSRRISEEAYDILVTSPGRLSSALERSEVKLDLLETLIFDEADQLLDMGFSKAVKSIMAFINKFHKGDGPQIALYSATWPAQYQNFLAETFEGFNFKEVICQGGVQLKRNIETYNIYLSVEEKRKMLSEFLELEGKGTGVVFFNRKEDVLKLSDDIKKEFSKRKVHTLHGGLSLPERKEAFKTFREKGGVLLASDIAARGLDIDELKWVLNFDLPFEAVYYVHRCGRTGRAGKLGKVYNFVTPADSNLMKRINEAILSQSSLALKTLEPAKKQQAPQKKSISKKASAINSKKKHKKQVARKRTPRYKKKNR
jgi:superfamily II DNA/RNA helicase